MAKDFEELRIWQEAERLLLEIYKITAKFPKEEIYSLTSQLKRAALSVPTNIAEGHGRRNYREIVQFLIIARGSISETRSLLVSARDIKYLNQDDINKLNLEYIGLSKGINSFITTLRQKL